MAWRKSKCKGNGSCWASATIAGVRGPPRVIAMRCGHQRPVGSVAGWDLGRSLWVACRDRRWERTRTLEIRLECFLWFVLFPGWRPDMEGIPTGNHPCPRGFLSTRVSRPSGVGKSPSAIHVRAPFGSFSGARRARTPGWIVDAPYAFQLRDLPGLRRRCGKSLVRLPSHPGAERLYQSANHPEGAEL